MQNSNQLPNLQLKGPCENLLPCAHLTEQEGYGYLIFQWHVHRFKCYNALHLIVRPNIIIFESSTTTRTTRNPILSLWFPTSFCSLSNLDYFLYLLLGNFRYTIITSGSNSSFLLFCALILHVWWFIVDPITCFIINNLAYISISVSNATFLNFMQLTWHMHIG